MKGKKKLKLVFPLQLDGNIAVSQFHTRTRWKHCSCHDIKLFTVDQSVLSKLFSYRDCPIINITFEERLT